MSGPIAMEWTTGALTGPPVAVSMKTLGQMRDLFRDRESAGRMDPATVLYRVQYWLPVAEGTPGGLFWGTTTIAPGRVGDEYFMTHGHLHVVRDRAEFYGTVSGQGALILMDESGATRAETMRPGSLHYIPGNTAHRVANTGDEDLVFIGCWPSDAGHDYSTVLKRGFGARLRAVDGRPVLVPERE